VTTTITDGANNLVNWVSDFLQGDSELAKEISDIIESTSDKLRTFLQNDVLSQVQTYAASIASGAIYVGKFLLNILIGLIVSVYLMASKEKFAGQSKKIVYAIFKPVRANVIVETARKSNEIFSGFISGKLLDSAIIGVIAYVVLAIMKMPDTILVAVIIGVTNIIPFFGPFIGAIPSFIIIVLQNPIQGLYFLIFVIVLQQVDGNIIGPKILGNSTGLSPFWVVFAILLFGGLWGFPGMVLGVPTMAVIYYIIKKVMEYFLRKRGLKEDTASYVELVKVDKDSNEMLYK
jgi:predicted PurR-regulated permease PerM